MLSDALRILVEKLPPRTSLVQAVGLCQIAEATFAGRDLMLGEVFSGEVLGSAHGKPSVSRIYATLLPPEPTRNPNGLNLLRIYAKPDDLRKKYVWLTAEGKALMNEVFKEAAKAGDVVEVNDESQ
ncbi:hypothetical protein WEU32_06945 [Brevundimonas sp. BH3]|uniref:hypothetical protein n=1 Tax=Brevundimonas sp. BH3 TaxID=3133089 RepID=UPI0032462FF1